MTYTLLEPARSFQKDYAKLPAKIQWVYNRALVKIRDEPQAYLLLTAPPWTGCRKIRVGGYRLIYFADSEAKTIELIKCGPRGQVYRQR